MKKLISIATRVAKTDFVKVSSWSAVATIIKMITGFVSIKIVARIIGPAGIAMVGQLINSVAMISSLGTGCIGQGVTKYVAEHFDEPAKQKNVITNAVRITLFSTAVMSLLVLIFYRTIGDAIFKTDKYDSIIVLFGS